jgi:hypothetical protein
MMLTENNWYSWQYGDGPLNGRYLPNKPFKTNYGRCADAIGTYKEELLKVARSTIDTFPNEKLILLFSGGSDSEVVLRSYLALGYPISVIIYRYENDFNLYDVSYAVTICNMLSVDYKIIDFNLINFYENDAERYAELSEIDRPAALPYLNFLEITDGIPVLGQGDPWWFRNQGINYSTKGSWSYGDMEVFTGTSKFLLTINKPGIPTWFKWRPGLVWAYTNLEWFKVLTNDGIIGKSGVSSTKLRGYKEVFPDMIHRVKATGFEKIGSLLTEFETFLSKKNNGLFYRQECIRTYDELQTDILGFDKFNNRP